MAGGDKQLYKRFNAEQGVKPSDLQALSPPQTSLGTSPAQSYFRFVPIGLWIEIEFITCIAVVYLETRMARFVTRSAEKHCFIWSPLWTLLSIRIMISPTPRVTNSAKNQVYNGLPMPSIVIWVRPPVTIIVLYDQHFGLQSMMKYHWTNVIFIGNFPSIKSYIDRVDWMNSIFLFTVIIQILLLIHLERMVVFGPLITSFIIKNWNV